MLDRLMDRLHRVDDVAEACVRLALAEDPPSEIEFGGAEQLTRHQVARLLRRVNPAMASVLGMAPRMDLVALEVAPGPLRRLGVKPRSTIEAMLLQRTPSQ